MKKPLSQIGLFDFVAESGQQPAERVSEPVRPASPAGVGVRLKSLKKEVAEIPVTIAVREVEPIANEMIPQETTGAQETAAASPVVLDPPQRPAKSTRGRKSLKQSSAEADLIDIPDDEILFLKQYYSMGEVAGMFRVNQSLLRFWETEFSILQPKKNKKGDRHFRPVDIKNLHLIYHLLRQRKYTIEGAKEFLKKNKKAEERFEAIKRLQQVKGFLLEWKAQL
jgi:DNA-binding transcriptional MerR regulator